MNGMRGVRNGRSSGPGGAGGRGLALLLTCVVVLGGCTRMRFVIDAVPAVDELTETRVLTDPGHGKAKIAMMDVTGVIVDSRPAGFLGRRENPVGRFLEELNRAADDPNVSAIIVRINSPGGTVTASDVMYRELMHFRERTHKPVVILMSGVAASGGYYLACAGDEIVAHPTTVTGSIGVIMQTFNVKEGMNRIGIRADAITSGPNKAAGSPFATMSDEHRQIFQEMIDEFYEGFLTVVRERRPGLSEADMRWVTDGRVITGRRAAEIGLVDRVGDLHVAYAAAKERAGLAASSLVKYHRPLDYVGSAYARAPAASNQVNFLQVNVASPPFAHQSGFYYLWDPTVW